MDAKVMELFNLVEQYHEVAKRKANLALISDSNSYAINFALHRSNAPNIGTREEFKAVGLDKDVLKAGLTDYMAHHIAQQHHQLNDKLKYIMTEIHARMKR